MAVRRLHAAGIEVMLDVVYNHTAEGNEFGPTLSFRGLDNASYYRLVPDNRRHYINDTGTGNTLNLSHPRVLQMVMDSLRYWVTSFHVDGFRFDLGVTLGREAHGSIPVPAFDALRQDPVHPREADLRALGPRPGRLPARPSPAGLRRMERPLPRQLQAFLARRRGRAPDFAARLAGSSDLFDAGRRPWARSTTSPRHDGFTLPTS